MKPLKQDMDDVHSPPNDGRMIGQTHESLSGLTTLISLNTEGFSRKKANILSSLCRVNDCAVLLLQETHRRPTRNRPKIPGLNLIVERPHDQYGSAIYVKPGLDVNNTNIYSDNNMEILSINLEGLTVTSIDRRDGVVVRASASQSVDLGFNPLVEPYQTTLKNGICSFPLGARHLWEVVENKPASSLVVSLGKALNGTPHLYVKDR